jgi:hypothetical protein
MEPIYANIISISASPSDVSVTLRWNVPAYNEKYEVTGQQIIKEQVVNMSPETFKSFAAIVAKTLAEINKTVLMVAVEK